MRLKLFLIVSAIGFLFYSSAYAADPVMAGNYELVFNGQDLRAKTANEIFPGTLWKKFGDYSQWSFHPSVDDSQEFAVVVNNRTKTLVDLEKDLYEGSARLIAASPANDYALLAYNKTTTTYEIRDSAGKIIVSKEYVGNDPIWNDEGLIYTRSAGLETKNPEALKACKQFGPPVVKGEWVTYDIKSNTEKKLDRPVKWVCLP